MAMSEADVLNIDSSVTTLMTTGVIVAHPGTPIPEIARLMVAHGISGVPVVEDDRIVGIVTEMDLVSQEIEVDPPAFGTFLDAIFRFPWDENKDEMRRVLATTAGALMNSEVVTVTPEATIQDAASLMFKREVNPLPVVDAAGRLLGIVSRSDIIRLIATADEESRADG